MTEKRFPLAQAFNSTRSTIDDLPGQLVSNNTCVREK